MKCWLRLQPRTLTFNKILLELLLNSIDMQLGYKFFLSINLYNISLEVIFSHAWSINEQGHKKY